MVFQFFGLGRNPPFPSRWPTLLESPLVITHTTEDAPASPHIHRAAGRVAGRAFRRNRFVDASIVAGSRIFRTLARGLHALFLETMGLFFLLFAASGAFAAYREYRAYSAGQVGIERAVLGLLFTLVFAYFAVTSFWRARRRQAGR